MSDGPICVGCGERPQYSIVGPDGERAFLGRCEPCAAARGEAFAQAVRERRAREVRTAEHARRERDGKPKVGDAPRGFR